MRPKIRVWEEWKSPVMTGMDLRVISRRTPTTVEWCEQYRINGSRWIMGRLYWRIQPARKGAIVVVMGNEGHVPAEYVRHLRTDLRTIGYASLQMHENRLARRKG